MKRKRGHAITVNHQPLTKPPRDRKEPCAIDPAKRRAVEEHQRAKRERWFI